MQLRLGDMHDSLCVTFYKTFYYIYPYFDWPIEHDGFVQIAHIGACILKALFSNTV